MLASNDNSYAKEYARRRHARGASRPGPGGVAGEMLLTDRGEYIRFLESQLDAVTNACLTAQSFDERIVGIGAASVAQDEKILNLARLIKCAQGVSEEQELAYHGAMERVHERIRTCESAVAKVAEIETEKVFAGKKQLRRKGLAGGDLTDENENPNWSDRPGGAGDPKYDGDRLTMGVLDAQFRAWADARERDVDARVVSLERRLAARVDDGVASVLDAVRKAERRLREESPRLAEHAARRLWTAAGSASVSGGGFDVGRVVNDENAPGSSGNDVFPFLNGGVASGASVASVLTRVEQLEASDTELNALIRATRELQNSHALELREHRAREKQRDKEKAAKEEGFALAEAERSRRLGLERGVDFAQRSVAERHEIDTTLAREHGQQGSHGNRDQQGNTPSSNSGEFAGFWGENARFPDPSMNTAQEALARSVEASARGFHRLGAQVSEIQKRVDDRDLEIARLRADLDLKINPPVSYRNSYRGNARDGSLDQRPAAMILADAAAVRLARESVERASRGGIRVPPPPPVAGRDDTILNRLAQETDVSLDGVYAEFDSGDAYSGNDNARVSWSKKYASTSIVDEAEARREKLAALYEKLEKTKLG